ncbi:hypothetical protein BDV93DRAFT_611258 [Ceratobasidium sp. AG-I]|nr:hypothetical protein BDV93DRAFT_611258 [Ceratobasidium sp. AG-I]
MHERYGRYPGDAPGYNGYPHGPRHNHYGPRPNQPQDRRHQYNPYTGQHDRSSYYPYPPSGFPGEYAEDPMASRWASHQFAPPLYPFGRPLFANVPELPNLLNRAGAPYPVLPAPPVEYLRDLDAQRTAPADKPSGPLSRTAPPAADFKDVLPLLEGKQTLPFLEALKKQELEPKYSDAVFRILSNVVQVRFGERENDKIINRVHVIPRGHYALGTVMADKPRLDVDLVLPSDFMLRRWLISPTDKDICPKTASEALGLDAVSIARSEVDAKKLEWVLNAVWEQLDGVADGFVFPGGATEAQNYLPAGWCSRDTAKPGKNRLRLMTTGDGSSIRVNIFVKVAVNLNGQEMIVGVDQSSAKSAGKYQMVKVLRDPSVLLGETPLSPIDRSAIITLNWWKRSTKADAAAGGFKIRTSHFLLALAALHALPPANDSHVARAENTPLPFSIVRVMDVMTKILKYLKQAYNPPPSMVTARDESGTPAAGAPAGPVGPAIQYVFPLSACTTMDALYTQAVSTTADEKSLKKREVLEQLETKVNAYIKGLESKGVEVKKYIVETD